MFCTLIAVNDKDLLFRFDSFVEVGITGPFPHIRPVDRHIGHIFVTHHALSTKAAAWLPRIHT